MDEERCTQCGTPASPGTKFCESCGAPLAVVSQPIQGVSSAEPAPPYAVAPVQYQGVAIRFVAILIDLIITGIISLILAAPLLSSIANTATGTVMFGPAYFATVGIGVVIYLLYFILLLGRSGQTVGMMIVKIRVVKEADYSAIGYGEAAIRTILLYIDEIPYFIPYLLGAILIWTSDKKQRLGDRAAHTVVVKA